MEGYIQGMARREKEKLESLIRNMTCKNEGCDNEREHGSSRCKACSDNYKKNATGN